jgi:hypothetical protein
VLIGLVVEPSRGLCGTGPVESATGLMEEIPHHSDVDVRYLPAERLQALVVVEANAWNSGWPRTPSSGRLTRAAVVTSISHCSSLWVKAHPLTAVLEATCVNVAWMIQVPHGGAIGSPSRLLRLAASAYVSCSLHRSPGHPRRNGRPRYSTGSKSLLQECWPFTMWQLNTAMSRAGIDHLLGSPASGSIYPGP